MKRQFQNLEKLYGGVMMIERIRKFLDENGKETTSVEKSATMIELVIDNGVVVEENFYTKEGKIDDSILKGGPGSGSWNGPNSPRFARDQRAAMIRDEGRIAYLHTRRGEELVEAKRKKDGTLVLANGKELPGFLPKSIPPAWTNVFVNTNPKGVLWAQGLDRKGKPQPIYNPDFRESRDAKKWEVVKQLEPKFKGLYKKVDGQADKGNNEAACLRLVMATGVRPTDSEIRKIKADKYAYGATSMLAKHVSVKGKDVVITFPAKKGTTWSTVVKDPKIAADLIKRKRKVGPDERIYQTGYNDVLSYSKKTTGYTPKNYRTLIGTKIAANEVANMPKPKTEKEYKKAVKKVAEVVSRQLCNRPSESLKSYISPVVFSVWQTDLKVSKKKELEFEIEIQDDFYLEIEDKALDGEGEGMDVMELLEKEDTLPDAYYGAKMEKAQADDDEEEFEEPDDDWYDMMALDKEDLDEMFGEEEEGKTKDLELEFVSKADMTKADWIEAWKEDPHWAKSDKPSKLAQDFVKLIKENKGVNVLEIGCGNGRDSIFFSREGLEVTAIDLSPDAIKIAKDNAKKAKVSVDFIAEDIEKWTSDKTFDGIYSLSVLHSTSMKKSIKNIASMMNEGAMALLYLYKKSDYQDGTEVNFETKDAEKIFVLNNLKEVDNYSFKAKDKDEDGQHVHYVVVYTLQKEKE